MDSRGLWYSGKSEMGVRGGCDETCLISLCSDCTRLRERNSSAAEIQAICCALLVTKRTLEHKLVTKENKRETNALVVTVND